MRILTILCLCTGLSAVALAHELPDSAGHAQQAAHQILSLHHLPALLLIVLAGLVLLWRIGKSGRDAKSKVDNS